MPFAAILREVDQLRGVSTPVERLAGSIENSPDKVAVMTAAFIYATFINATSISFGLLVVIVSILLLHWMRKVKLQITGDRSQRMCPFCGLITSRSKTRCLECGVASDSKP
jgi:hypothetical protein